MAARRRARRTTGYASPGEVEQFAHQLPEAYLTCRDLGHSWRPFTARALPRREGGGFERVVKCSRCPTRRVEHLSTSGERLASNMAYPKGYLHKGLGRIVGEGRDVLRLESVTRVLDKPARRSRLRVVGE